MSHSTGTLFLHQSLLLFIFNNKYVNLWPFFLQCPSWTAHSLSASYDIRVGSWQLEVDSWQLTVGSWHPALSTQHSATHALLLRRSLLGMVMYCKLVELQLYGKSSFIHQNITILFDVIQFWSWVCSDFLYHKTTPFNSIYCYKEIIK